jgi:hypothetical protein
MIIIIEDKVFLKACSCGIGILLSRPLFFFSYAQSLWIHRAYQVVACGAAYDDFTCVVRRDAVIQQFQQHAIWDLRFWQQYWWNASFWDITLCGVISTAVSGAAVDFILNAKCWTALPLRLKALRCFGSSIFITPRSFSFVKAWILTYCI